MESKAGNTTKAYLKTKVMTASPEQLQMMLYDGVIRFCEQARQAIQDIEIEKSHTLLTRAENIILEMCCSMRDEIAPETCAKMRSLYIYCYEQLITANMKRDVVYLDNALKVIRHMRETWIMLMKKIKQEKAAQHLDDQLDQTGQPAADPANTFSEEPFEQPVGSNISLEG